jgi:hypothetical protein
LLDLGTTRGSYGGLKLLGAKGKCLLGPKSWQRDKSFLDGGEGALPKVLEAHMGEAVWPPNLPEAERHSFHGHWPNMGAWLPSMAQVVVVLLRQCDDQLDIGFSWLLIKR